MTKQQRLFQFTFAVLASGVFLAGLTFVGRAARDELRRQERYTIAFADIECAPPPGQERGEFLDEVQYLAGLPDHLWLLDDDVAERLHQAFARHPWVEKVARVETTLSPQVRVELVYRTPVLGVPLIQSGQEVPGGVVWLEAFSGGGCNAAMPGRTVDREGILLPTRATWPCIPIVETHESIKSPAGPAGTHWGDPTVEAAARIAGVLYAHKDDVQLMWMELKDGEWVLHTLPGNDILWGRPPGRELPDETPASRKVELLLDYCKRHGELGSPDGPYQHDVRSPKSLSSRRLSVNGHR
jgi:hypothetical protein